MSMRHNFPLDGEYEIRVRLWRATADVIKGLEDVNQLEVSVDGVRTRLITIGGPTDRDLSYENSGKSAEEIDKRKKLIKTLMQLGAFEFAPLNDAELKTWARSRLKTLGAEADPEILHLIVQLVGQDVRRLNNELGKLAAAAMPSGKITVELVEALVSRSRELMNWELTDQMLLGNRRRALQTLEHLLDDGAPPLMLIGLIASNYRRMALAQWLLSQGAPSREIFRQVPMPPFKQNSFLATLNRTDGRTLARKIGRIAAADLGIKTSKATPRMQVEMLVCELMS